MISKNLKEKLLKGNYSRNTLLKLIQEETTEDTHKPCHNCTHKDKELYCNGCGRYPNYYPVEFEHSPSSKRPGHRG